MKGGEGGKVIFSKNIAEPPEIWWKMFNQLYSWLRINSESFMVCLIILIIKKKYYHLLTSKPKIAFQKAHFKYGKVSVQQPDFLGAFLIV